MYYILFIYLNVNSELNIFNFILPDYDIGILVKLYYDQ